METHSRGFRNGRSKVHEVVGIEKTRKRIAYAKISVANVIATLAILSETKIAPKRGDSNGHYAFTDVAPGFYNITATKRSYWPDSNPVTVNAIDPITADIVLCQKGDFNTNSEPADAGDLAKMADTAVNATLRDETYDLDGDGNPADEADLTLLKNVSVGVAKLE
jgi:hypothetical protein